MRGNHRLASATEALAAGGERNFGAGRNEARN